MSERTVNPELFHVSAAVLDWMAIARAQGAASSSLGRVVSEAVDSAAARGDADFESLQLRWMVAPAIGLPRKPFVVYYCQQAMVLQRVPNAFGQIFGEQRMDFGELMGILQFEFDLNNSGAFVLAFSQNGALLTAATAPAGTTGVVRLTLQDSAMAYVLFGATGNLMSIYGLPSQTIVNLAAWLPIERVGLPIEPATFAGSGYATGNQGFVAAPETPVNAARRRLHEGMPLVGWPTEISPGVAAPPWTPPTVNPLIADLQQQVLGDILQMLKSSAGEYADANVTLNKPIPTPAQAGGGSPAPLAQSSQATYSPLAILLLAAGSDPFNALGLGFGTAYTFTRLQNVLAGSDTSASSVAPAGGGVVNFVGFMVTADYEFDVFGIRIGGEMADFVSTDIQLGLTPSPTNLTAQVASLNPPLVRDQPYSGTVEAQWDRPLPLIPTQTVAASYAVARFATGQAATLLNAKRTKGGFMPYVPALAPTADATAPIAFEDVQVPPPSGGASLSFSVAAQDWFGVWSGWTVTQASFPSEPLIGPTVTDATLALNETSAAPYTATLTVQITYNWTIRSPSDIDILVSLFRPPDQVTPLPAQTPPSGIQFTVGGAMRPPASLTFDAAGNPSVTGVAGASVTQLPPPSFANPQQDIRVYSVVIPGFSLDFAGASGIIAFVFATGYETVNPSTPVTTPKPRAARVMSPVPPPVPHYDSIVWASLPDQRGISRVHLTWDPSGAPSGTNFLIYGATETGLLGAAGAPPADLTASYASRLAALRALDLTTCRTTFRRLATTPAHLSAPSQEIELPRGTRVIHAFVVTAVSPNNIETPFPTDASKFIAVAVPYVETSRAPRIIATLIAQSGISQAQITVESRKGVTPDRFLLYRTQGEGLSRDADLMGAPITDSDQGGWTKTPVDPTDGTWTATYIDPTPPGALHPWQRIWYRAVAIADDHLVDPTGNPLGALGGRSPSSSAAAIVVPPANPPPVTGATAGTIDHAHNTVLISFKTAAPIAATALGSHTLIVTVTDAQQPVAKAMTWRAVVALDLIPRATALPASGTAGTVVRLSGTGGLTTIGILVPRPQRATASVAPFAVSVGITDPVNRTGEQTVTVGWWT